MLANLTANVSHFFESSDLVLTLFLSNIVVIV